LNGGAWHPDSPQPASFGGGSVVEDTGSAMREDRVTKRTVSDGFWSSNESCEGGARAQTSAEGALLGSARGEVDLNAASDFPGPRDGDGHG